MAGGHGTRLHPLTSITSKQLLPVYDKPMIFYPLSTLMLLGLRDIAIISTARDLLQYKPLLGSGKNWGLKLTYFEQERPKGIADAFIVCADFIGDDNVSLILGDNILYGNLRLEKLSSQFINGALIFGYAVSNPKRYGIIEFDDRGIVVGIEEKPEKPKEKDTGPSFGLQTIE